MTHDSSTLAILVFLAFVAVTLGISFYLGKQAQSSAGYFAAHGQIPWFVNGVAFAGDYLSAASFLGICGMIAFYGYDGFLYSIGYLAGWVVALFVVAEPMKRLGKFTFADALNSRFNSRGIKLAAGISTLAVSVFYLIPQMVGAGVLVQPLLGLPHWVGVVLVGAVVIFIVVTAGMVSTTWVQFIKGSLLVVFSAVLTVLILVRGFHVGESAAGELPINRLGPFTQSNLTAELARMRPRLPAAPFCPRTGPGRICRSFALESADGPDPRVEHSRLPAMARCFLTKLKRSSNVPTARVLVNGSLGNCRRRTAASSGRPREPATGRRGTNRPARPARVFQHAAAKRSRAVAQPNDSRSRRHRHHRVSTRSRRPAAKSCGRVSSPTFRGHPQRASCSTS